MQTNTGQGQGARCWPDGCHSLFCFKIDSTFVLVRVLRVLSMALLLLQASFLRTLRAAAYLAYTIKAAGAARTHTESVTSMRFYKTFMFLRGCSPVSIAVTFFRFHIPTMSRCLKILPLLSSDQFPCIHNVLFCSTRNRVSVHCPGWPQRPGLKQSSCLSLPSSYRCTLHLARKERVNNCRTLSLSSSKIQPFLNLGDFSEKFLKLKF